MLHRNSLAILLTCLFCFVCLLGTHAQPYYFRHYQVENGLSNSTVFCSTQDKRGFLWFGTKEGLNRFDGYRFKLFSPRAQDSTQSSSAGSDLVYCLQSDTSGVLWVGAQNGLFRFDTLQEKLVRVIDGLTEINYVQAGSNDELWFLSFNRVYRYNLRTRRLTHFPPEKNFYATSICKSADGDIWFTTNDGFIKKYDTAKDNFITFDLFSHSPQPSSRWLQRIRCAGGHQFLVGTSSQGIKLFDGSTGTYRDLMVFNPDKTSIFVRDILQYSTDEFWLGTESGVFIINLKTGAVTNLRKKFLDPYSLSDNAVYTLCRDSEGGVWVGTFFGGVNYYSRQYSSFQKYFPDNTTSSISGSAVREICQDATGNIWIGTEDAGLNKLNPSTGAITHFLPGGSSADIDYTNIHGLLTVGNDCWIGTFEHGLDVMNIKTGKVYRRYLAGPGPHELKSNFILCLIQTASGQIIMGSSNGAYTYRAATNDFAPLPDIPTNIFVAAILEDHEGTIWIGTHGSGVFYYNPKTGMHGHYDGRRSKANTTAPLLGMINAITEDDAGNVWFSTEGEGAWRLSADRTMFTAFTSMNGLPSDFIFKIVEDNNKDIWLTTSRGLVNLHKGNLPAIIYTRSNGLLNDQFNYSSGFRDTEGRLYFGSVKGMITFKPEDFIHSGYLPSVYITGFQVDNQDLTIGGDGSLLRQSILYTRHIILPHDRSSFSIDFAALSFTAPERIEYMYKMDGLDKNWTRLKSNRKVYFTHLAPGHYRFRVKAAAGGAWGDNERDVLVEVLPPLWGTTAAYMLYALLLGCLVYYIVRSYHHRTEIKKEKEIYEAKIDFFTNIAHEIRTPLTLIKGPVENLHEKIDELPEIKEDVVTMERNTSRLIALVNQILDFRQTETRGFSLEFNRVNITGVMQENYLNFSALAKKKKLDYQFEHPPADIFAMADEEALHKIFSNLFSNAVKYSQEMVRIRLQAPANQIVVEVSNDGPLIPGEMKEKIFEPFYRLKGNGKQKGTGLGLALARSLAELHEGKLFVEDNQSGLNTFIFTLTIHQN